MKTNRRLYIAAIAVLIIAVACVCIFAGCEAIDKVKETAKDLADKFTVTDGAGIELTDGEVHEMPTQLIFMARNTDMTSVASKKSVTLTATVTPSTAANKTVDWSVSWAFGSSEFASSHTVTEYVTVTPTSDGSTTATVDCYQAFPETELILITVRTRNGGYTATCNVTFVGYPSTLSIDKNGKTFKNDIQWGKGIIELDSGSDYSFDLLLNNAFGSVGASFAPNYTISLSIFGSVNITLTSTNRYDSSETTTVSKELNLLSTGNNIVMDTTNMSGSPEFQDFRIATLSIEAGKLKISALASPSAFSQTGGNQSYSSQSVFSSYVDNKEPYITVTVTETNTGISDTLDFRVISSVTGVSLNNASLIF